MVPLPLSCHFLGSPLRKTALLTEGCQKNTAKLLRPSAVNRSHCWAEGHAKTTLKRGVCTETGTVVNFLFADWYDPLRSETPVQCIYNIPVCSTHLMSIRPKMQEARERFICQGASMLPTSYWHGCRLQLLFRTVLPTYTLHLLLFFVLIGLDNIVKTLPRCYLQTYIEEPVFSCTFQESLFKQTGAFCSEQVSLLGRRPCQDHTVMIT